MLSMASGAIKKSEYTFTISNSRSYSELVPVDEDEDKIFFAHWYDATDGIYTTTDTSYEGIHIGKGLSKIADFAEDSSWALWRTNSAGTMTGMNAYGISAPFYENHSIRVCSNPRFYNGHIYILEVYSIN